MHMRNDAFALVFLSLFTHVVVSWSLVLSKKYALQQEQPRERVSLDLLHQLISATTLLFVYCGDSIRSSENRP